MGMVTHNFIANSTRGVAEPMGAAEPMEGMGWHTLCRPFGALLGPEDKANATNCPRKDLCPAMTSMPFL